MARKWIANYSELDKRKTERHSKKTNLGLGNGVVRKLLLLPVVGID